MHGLSNKNAITKKLPVGKTLSTKKEEKNPNKPESFPIPVLPFDSFTVGKSLGKGSFGEVFQCNWNDTTIALKLLTLRKLNQKLRKEIETQFKIYSSPVSQNVVQMLGICWEENHYAFIMPLADSTLSSYLESKKITIGIKFGFAVNIISGLEYLHSVGVQHQDLCPKNILIFGNIAKLSGFKVFFFDDIHFRLRIARS